MKNLISTLFILLILVACSPNKELQVSVEVARLEKIDTCQRWDEKSGEMKPQLTLTWAVKNVHFTSFQQADEIFKVGSRMILLLPR